jgi:eukaryotic-like serine/threonine-protein kinase
MGVSLEQFVESLAETKVLAREGIAPFLSPAAGESLDAVGLGRRLVAAGKLTRFQAKMVYEGRAKELVLGDYVLLEPIGKGGMGQVFKAQHQRMETIVALKLMRKAAVASPDARLRF